MFPQGLVSLLLDHIFISNSRGFFVSGWAERFPLREATMATGIHKRISHLQIHFIFLPAIFILACVPPESVKRDPNLPSSGFQVQQIRSDLERPVRKGKEEYPGPIFDVHVHLDPPMTGNIQKRPLQKIIESMDRAGVVSMIVMPVPNEGHIKHGVVSIGAEQRKMLRRMGGEKLNFFAAANTSPIGCIMPIMSATRKVTCRKYSGN